MVNGLQLDGQGQSLNLGPYDAEFEFQQAKGRNLGNAVDQVCSLVRLMPISEILATSKSENSSMSEVQMSSFFGENAEGGTTRISAGTFNTIEEDGPKTPPWEKKAESTPSQ